ncbi:carbohydrate ABC transporter permease [Paenibacillus sp. JCM 10914]|uniref:carbohydrate ABC transporter permease n=1 Tax=Paenibacillus sp. JCM 10914 TaxID=1236974 RepID=UPI0003CC576F|nr:carbohydrate ABC transporter permease [Paenibacillus sp. JCM 10914]GAE07089.1 binding-protein-dependent transport systems inner membrane component [Paenibacillus sp. JCM 10914]
MNKIVIRTVSQLEKKEWPITLKKKALLIFNRLALYVVLLSLSFVFVYPLLFILSQSMMLPSDISDSTVQWIPQQLSFINYSDAFLALGGAQNRTYWDAFLYSFIISFGSAALQVFSCALAGYALGRYRFPGYMLCMSLVLFTFLVPPQTIVVPLFRLFSDLGWINTFWPFIVPSATGHGLKGALFVLIFIQFFHRLPSVLEEAARIDGASAFRTYWTIMLPLARPAMLVVFLFSVVWHWNDLFEPNLYLRIPNFYNLSQTLGIFNGVGSAQMDAATSGLTAAQTIGAAPTIMNKIMAAAMLTVLPMLVLYLFTQRYFVESVERAGIAGE